MEKLKQHLPVLAALVLVSLVVLSVLYGLNRGHRMLLDARREAEAAKLALAHQIVVEQESKEDLKADMQDLVNNNSALKAALEDALAAAPDAKPSEHAALRTGPIKVEGQARVTVPVTEPEVGTSAPLLNIQKESPIDPTAYMAVSQCVLQNGDQASIRVDQIELATKAGNTLIVGTAEVWRESPEPKGKFLAGKFQSYLSDVHGLATPAPPRWGAELGALCTRDGCGPGAGVLLPPVGFLGLRWEARAGVYAGPVLGAQGALGARW